LNDNVNTCFYTNYYFEHNGKRVNDYDELSSLEFQKDLKIYMKPDLYNERTARTHYKKFKEILYNPGVLNLSNDIIESLSSPLGSDKKAEQQETTKATNEHSEISKTEDANPAIKDEDKIDESKESEAPKEEATQETSEDKKVEEAPTEKSKSVEDTKKQEVEEYNKLVKNLQDALEEAKKNIPPPNLDKKKVKLSEVFNTPLEKDMPSFKPVKCIESIGFSTFNPVPSSQELKGDLFYLRVRTLEGQEFVITSSVRGFYVNNSSEGNLFDPTPCQKGNPCYSHSLVGLMCQLSQRF
jgi:hypothetical protein